MKLDEKMSKVVADLEYCVGSECYNPNSYDGWNDIEGCDFRYPINFPNEKGDYKKIRGNLVETPFLEEEDINPNTVTFMKYKFGSNHLYIGQGIINIMSYLEERYHLDFNKLEDEIIKQND